MGFNILRFENQEVINDWHNVEIKIIEHIKKITLPPTP